jgi:hypothetical protein
MDYVGQEREQICLFIHSFIMRSVNPYKVNQPIEYRNLSKYKCIVVIK